MKGSLAPLFADRSGRWGVIEDLLGRACTTAEERFDLSGWLSCFFGAVNDGFSGSTWASGLVLPSMEIPVTVLVSEPRTDLRASGAGVLGVTGACCKALSASFRAETPGALTPGLVIIRGSGVRAEEEFEWPGVRAFCDDGSSGIGPLWIVGGSAPLREACTEPDEALEIVGRESVGLVERGRLEGLATDGKRFSFAPDGFRKEGFINGKSGQSGLPA